MSEGEPMADVNDLREGLLESVRHQERVDRARGLTGPAAQKALAYVRRAYGPYDDR